MDNENKMRAPVASDKPTTQPAVKKDTRIEGSATEGLVEAIASTAMAVASLLMMLSVLSVIAELLCMYGLILGIRAVNTYRSCHLWQKKNPKATGILGITGLVLNAIAVLVWLVWIVFTFMDMFMLPQAAML